MQAMSPLRELRLGRMTRHGNRLQAHADAMQRHPAIAEIPTLIERVDESDVTLGSDATPGLDVSAQTGHGASARSAGPARESDGSRGAQVRFAWMRLAGTVSRPRLMVLAAVCCLGGLAVFDIAMGVHGERTLQGQRDRARAMRETLELLEHPVVEVPPLLKSAAVSRPDQAGFPAQAAAGTLSPARARVPALAAQAGEAPQSVQQPSEGSLASSAAPEQAASNDTAQRSEVHRAPIGRYLDGPDEEGASTGVRIDRPASTPGDPLRSTFIKAELTAASAPFQVAEIREQQFGWGALVVEAAGRTPLWVHAGHVFPNGWTVVDVTPKVAAFLSPGGRVFKLEPYPRDGLAQ
jgi:hypothetical protein